MHHFVHYCTFGCLVCLRKLINYFYILFFVVFTWEHSLLLSPLFLTCRELETIEAELVLIQKHLHSQRSTPQSPKSFV